MPCGSVGVNKIWYLVQTKTREEFRAKEHLERQSYECYCPIDSDGPFFPGYVFVRAEDRDYSPIKSTRGVLRLVGFPSPLPVSDDLINAYKATDWIRSDNFKPGAKVHINDHGGIWKHRDALLKSRKGDRAIVLIEFLGRQHDAIMPTKAVELA